MRFFTVSALLLITLTTSNCSTIHGQTERQDHLPIAWRYGGAAPSWQGATATRGTLSSTSLANRLVVLSFWATWCEPCIEELPSLERLQRTLGADGVSVVTVLTDDDLFAAERAWREQGLSLPIVVDSDLRISTLFRVGSVPQSFLIGPRGRFVEIQDGLSGRFSSRLSGTREWNDPPHHALIQTLLEER